MSSTKISLQTPTTQGVAVLFFATYEGSLMELEYDPIVFGQVLVNQGSAYDSTTGVFTAPIAGIYQFVFTAQLCRGNHNNSWYFKVNGVKRMSCLGQVTGWETTRNDCSFMEELKKGDRVWIRQKPDSCAWASTTSRTINFSGVLLASEGVSKLGEKYRSCPLPGPPRDVVSGSPGGDLALCSLAIPLLLCCFFFQ
ncbi:unnamed protein product [Ophioblennius macclurei]